MSQTNQSSSSSSSTSSCSSPTIGSSPLREQTTVAQSPLRTVVLQEPEHAPFFDLPKTAPSTVVPAAGDNVTEAPAAGDNVAQALAAGDNGAQAPAQAQPHPHLPISFFPTTSTTPTLLSVDPRLTVYNRGGVATTMTENEVCGSWLGRITINESELVDVTTIDPLSNVRDIQYNFVTTLKSSIRLHPLSKDYRRAK